MLPLTYAAAVIVILVPAYLYSNSAVFDLACLIWRV